MRSIIDINKNSESVDSFNILNNRDLFLEESKLEKELFLGQISIKEYHKKKKALHTVAHT